MDYNTPPTNLKTFSPAFDSTNGACGTFHYPVWTGTGLDYPITCMHYKKRTVPLMFIGTEGVGIGIRIRCSLKYGDQRIIEQHRNNIATPGRSLHYHQTVVACWIMTLQRPQL
ncbi:hypothetical protein BGZ47_010619 [Haplosporangium gracile]|nr:hypothetical protein BGZ47_010619 [Haplosporangium gracile]